MKVVYATMVADLFHEGQLKFIKKAKKLGDYLVIGLHPDDIVKLYKRFPIFSFENRKQILESIKEVDLVVEDCMDFREPSMMTNLKKYKVDIVVHGVDWLPPLYKKAKELGYNVIQIDSNSLTSTTKIINKLKGESPYLKKKNAILVSAGDSITAKLIENEGFDGIWVSGFEASARLGLEDNNSMTMTEMINVTKPIVEATNLPVIVDVDNGYGGIDNFIRTVFEFEKIGCAGICVEDNLFPKQNSLWGGKIPLLSMKEHGEKIKIGKKVQRTKNFMIIARTEALIRGYGIEEAIKRAEYYDKCGADMILIHSREPSGKEALKIPEYWKSKTPLVIVPTKFPQIKNKELFDVGFSLVILANQTERTKIKAIKDCLKLMKKDNLISIEKEFSASLDDMNELTKSRWRENENK